GMEKHHRIPCAWLQGLRYGVGGFARLAVLIERPGQRVSGVDIATHLKLFLSEGQSVLQLHVMIGIEQSQLAIIEHLVNRVELADKLDQVILLLRLLRTANLRVHVPQGCHVNRIRNDGDGSLIELDGFRISRLSFAHRGESRQSPVIARIRSQGVLISRLGVLQIVNLKEFLSQLILAPGNVLAGKRYAAAAAMARRMSSTAPFAS